MVKANMMTAVVINQYGDEDQLSKQEMPIPTIAEDELLVKVESIAVNPIDWKTRQGLRQERYPL